MKTKQNYYDHVNSIFFFFSTKVRKFVDENISWMKQNHNKNKQTIESKIVYQN